MLLYFVLWMVVGYICQFLLGVYYGFKGACICRKYNIEDSRGWIDYFITRSVTLITLRYDPLKKLGVKLTNNHNKLWHIIALLNNAWIAFMWPFYIPIMWQAASRGHERLTIYGKMLTMIRTFNKEGS